MRVLRGPVSVGYNQCILVLCVILIFSWGDPRLKSGALQHQILKSLKMLPRQDFKAPGSNSLLKVSKRAVNQSEPARQERALVLSARPPHAYAHVVERGHQ